MVVEADGAGHVVGQLTGNLEGRGQADALGDLHLSADLVDRPSVSRVGDVGAALELAVDLILPMWLAYPLSGPVRARREASSHARMVPMLKSVAD